MNFEFHPDALAEFQAAALEYTKESEQRGERYTDAIEFVLRATR
jgi:hypothetical protein